MNLLIVLLSNAGSVTQYLENINEFQSFIYTNSWNHFNVLGVLYKIDDRWEIVYARITLEIGTPEIRKDLVDAERIKFFNIKISFSEFNKFWADIVNERMLRLGDIEAHTNLLTCPMSFYTHSKEQVQKYGINENAFYMIWSGNMTISNLLPDIDDVIRDSDTRYNNLKHACDLNLGITCGSGSYSPHLVVIAPFYVSLGSLKLKKNRNVLISISYQEKERLEKTKVRIYCSSLDGQKLSEASNYHNVAEFIYHPAKGFERVVVELRYNSIKSLIESDYLLLTDKQKIKGKNQMSDKTIINYPNISSHLPLVEKIHSGNVDEIDVCRNLRTAIIQSLNHLNSFGNNIFGVRLFRTEALFFEPLEKGCIELSRNPTKVTEFTSVLLSLANLIESITEEAKLKALEEFSRETSKPKTKLEGSINIIAFLFHTEKLPEDEPFEPLRNIKTIRNQTFPIHNGNSDTIKLLKVFDIQFPIINFHVVAKKLMESYLNCINNLCEILKKKYYNE